MKALLIVMNPQRIINPFSWDKPTVRYNLHSNTQWPENVNALYVIIVEHLAANLTDISLSKWWRPKQGKSQGECLTCIRQVARNATPVKY